MENHHLRSSDAGNWAYGTCEVISSVHKSHLLHKRTFYNLQGKFELLRIRRSSDRQTDRQEDTVTEMENDRTGWRNKPNNPSLFNRGYGIWNEVRRRLHTGRLHHWKWLIYSEESKTGRKADERDMESSGDWHSIFLNSNPITSAQFPYG